MDLRDVSIRDEFFIGKFNNTFFGIKVGHAGTLDPLATGLLIICTGRMTKRIDEFSCLNKTYTGKITIGSPFEI